MLHHSVPPQNPNSTQTRKSKLSRSSSRTSPAQVCLSHRFAMHDVTNTYTSHAPLAPFVNNAVNAYKSPIRLPSALNPYLRPPLNSRRPPPFISTLNNQPLRPPYYHTLNSAHHTPLTRRHAAQENPLQRQGLQGASAAYRGRLRVLSRALLWETQAVGKP